MRKWIVCSALLYLSYTIGTWAFGAFTDLDFESSTLVPISGDPYGRVNFNSAMPGWSGFSGTNQLNAALYNNIFLDSTGIGIFDTSASFVPLTGEIIQGDYSVSLDAGLQLGSTSIPADASFAQTGLVPIGTKSLSFLAATNGPFAVSLGGATLSVISSPVAGHKYRLYQADVSAFAGQTAELKFTVFAANPYNNRVHDLVLDDIQFSPDAIPEPSGLSLLLIAIAALVLWRRTNRPFVPKLRRAW